MTEIEQEAVKLLVDRLFLDTPFRCNVQSLVATLLYNKLQSEAEIIVSFKKGIKDTVEGIMAGVDFRVQASFEQAMKTVPDTIQLRLSEIISSFDWRNEVKNVGSRKIKRLVGERVGGVVNEWIQGLGVPNKSNKYTVVYSYLQGQSRKVLFTRIESNDLDKELSTNPFFGSNVISVIEGWPERVGE